MGRLFLLFTLIPLLEVFLLVQLTQATSLATTFFFVIATGVLGAYFAKREGARVIREWQTATRSGRMPAEGILGGVLVLVGGTLLVAPGVLTDVVGLLLLFPPTRRAIAPLVRRWLERRIANGSIHVSGFRSGPPGGRGPGAGANAGRVEDGGPDAPIRGRVISSEDEA